MKKNLIILIIIILIILGGYWYFNNQSTEPEIVDNTNTNKDQIDVSDWQAYRNEELGFEFKYPSNWEYRINNDGFIYLKDSNKDYYLEGSITDLIVISTSNLSDYDSVDAWIEKWTISKEQYGSSVENIKINDYVNGLRAFDYLGIYTAIYSNSNVYSISQVNLGSEDINKNISEVYEEILNSWKFIE
ncbi:MAG: hypothetical protein HOD06_02530 [Candidatus Komeilibacteria bacterium]|jgi:hypothetical protein|nr:hypothetical protein [Candidatus Komeilibacteria bacterium]